VPGFKGLSRLPGDTVRARRNASRLATDAETLFEAPLSVGGDGIIQIATGDGLEVVSDELAVDLASATPGLEFDSGGLAVLLDPTEPGLQLTSGMKVLLAGTPGLELSSGLKAKVKTAGGVLIGADGLYVDDTVFVPYTGATADLDLGAHNFSADGTGHFGGILDTDSNLVVGGVQAIGTTTLAYVGLRIDKTVTWSAPTEVSGFAAIVQMDIDGAVDDAGTAYISNAFTVDFSGTLGDNCVLWAYGIDATGIFSGTVDHNGTEVEINAGKFTTTFSGTNTDNQFIRMNCLYAKSITNIGTTGSTEKRGLLIELAGTADVSYGILISSIDNATANYAIWDDSARDWVLASDDQKIYFGVAQDAYIEFDGDSLNVVANAVTGTDTLRLTAADVTVIGHSLSIGDATAATDSVVNFLGLNNSASITFDESADEFDFGDADITTADDITAGDRVSCSYLSATSAGVATSVTCATLDATYIEYSVGDLNIHKSGADSVIFFGQATTGTTPYLGIAGYITDGADEVEARFAVKDVDDYFWLERETIKILGFKIDMPVDLVDNALTTTGTISTPEIYNTNGDLKIQPDIQGNVYMFGDADVATIGTDGKKFRVYRKSTEGDGYLEMYVDQYERGIFTFWGDAGKQFFIQNARGGYAFRAQTGYPISLDDLARTSQVDCFVDATDSEGPPFKVYGFPTGESKKYLQFQIVSGPMALLSSDSNGIALGAAANHSIFSTTGDLVFVGTAGLPFGCLDGIDETVTCTNQNTWYQVTFDAAGPVNLVEADVVNNELQVDNAGVYFVTVTACFHSTVSHDFELMVKKTDGTVDLMPHLFQTTAAANRVENAAGSCLIDIDAADRVELWVRCTDAAGQDAIFDHVSLTLGQQGGT